MRVNKNDSSIYFIVVSRIENSEQKCEYRRLMRTHGIRQRTGVFPVEGRTHESLNGSHGHGRSIEEERRNDEIRPSDNIPASLAY